MAVSSFPESAGIQAPPVIDPPAYTTRHANLALADLGARVVACSDDFFGAAERMLQSAPAVFYPERFDDHGKWMDGWETRRRRQGGHDYAVVRLGIPGVIHGVDIDTSHFTGNFPPAASIQACRCADGKDPDENSQWFEILSAVPLSASAHHFFELFDSRAWTHIRLNIYPDGGVARLRIYGQPECDWSTRNPDALHEVSALGAGGRIVGYSDAHYGSLFRILMEGRGVNMGDGWETRRRREPGYDWCVVELGHACVVEKIEVDTAHFKGNYPDRVSIQAASVQFGTDESIITQAMFWPELLGEQKTQAHTQHFFEGEQIHALGPVTHVRLNMFPDGGISRLRIWGRLAR